MCVYDRCEASTVSIIYLGLLAFRPLLSKAVNRLQRINNDKLKSPSLGYFFTPTLPTTHLDAPGDNTLYKVFRLGRAAEYRPKRIVAILEPDSTSSVVRRKVMT